jgi:hypothetical protein
MDTIVHELQLLELEDGRKGRAESSPPSGMIPLHKKGDCVRVTSHHNLMWYLQTGAIQSARGSHFWNVMMDLRLGNTRRFTIHRTPQYLELLPSTD